jgi:hypothetical protein
MFNNKFVQAAALAGALAIVPAAATVSAQPPVVIGGGLVNVQIVDVIDDITVNVEDINVALGVGLQLAANVCDVSVNVLAEQLRNGGATCDSVVEGTGSYVTITR